MQVVKKQRFLIVYDYGMGGVWAFIHARSRGEIERRMPDLKMVDETPAWMSRDVIKRIEERMTFDIDRPHGWLSRIAVAPDDSAAG
ncbi:MAG: hypothetical protein ACRDLB_11970 [Actinomycetota bacterium]